MENKVEEFLDELTKLTYKCGIKIAGCGCCGSPYLCPINKEEKFKYSVCNDYASLGLDTE